MKRLMLWAVLVGGSAQAELIEIAWGAAGRFEHSTTVAPGRFAELCGKLAKGQTVAWSFNSAQSMDFNIHYHQGKQVVFPVRRNGATTLDGRLMVPLDQDYCWMWTNKTTAPATLAVRLQR